MLLLLLLLCYYYYYYYYCYVIIIIIIIIINMLNKIYCYLLFAKFQIVPAACFLDEFSPFTIRVIRLGITFKVLIRERKKERKKKI